MVSARRMLHSVYGWVAGGYERRALDLLLLVLVLDYADRTLVGALGPTLKQAFGIGNFKLGLLSAAFLFVGAGAALPMGMLTDRISRTALLAGSFALWAAAIGVVGASVSFAMFFGARVLLGIVSAASGPTIPSLVGDIVPTARRGRALGIVNGGLLAGLGIGYILPATIASLVSWRWCFWLLGIAGAALAYAFWRLKEPERTGVMGPSGRNGAKGEQESSRVRQMVRERNVEPSPSAMLERDPSEMTMWDAAKYTVRVRTDLIGLIARSIGDFFFQGIATFAVVFATGWYGISQGTADMVILVIGVGAIAGVLLLGRVSDALLGRGRLNSRIWVGASGYLLAVAALYPAFISRSLAVAVPLFAIGAFFLAGARPSLDAIRVDVLVGRLRGRAESVRQVLRSVFEGVAPVVLGGLSGMLGGGAEGLRLAFLIVLPTLLLNGVIILIALRTYQSDVAAAIASTEKDSE